MRHVRHLAIMEWKKDVCKILVMIPKANIEFGRVE